MIHGDNNIGDQSIAEAQAELPVWNNLMSDFLAGTDGEGDTFSYVFKWPIPSDLALCAKNTFYQEPGQSGVANPDGDVAFYDASANCTGVFGVNSIKFTMTFSNGVQAVLCEI